MRWSDIDMLQFVEASATRQRYFFVDNGSRLREVLWAEGPGSDLSVGWSWQSNWIKGTSGNVGNLKKRFRELLVSSSGGSRFTLKTWVDNDEDYREVSFDTRDDLYFQRVPIERRGERLRFRLEGMGPFTIRGLRLDGML